MPSVPPRDSGGANQLRAGGRQPLPRCRWGNRGSGAPAGCCGGKRRGSQHYGMGSRPEREPCQGSRGAGTRALPRGGQGWWVARGGGVTLVHRAV